MSYPGCCDACGFSEEQHRPDGAASFCRGFVRLKSHIAAFVDRAKGRVVLGDDEGDTT